MHYYRYIHSFVYNIANNAFETRDNRLKLMCIIEKSEGFKPITSEARSVA